MLRMPTFRNCVLSDEVKQMGTHQTVLGALFIGVGIMGMIALGVVLTIFFLGTAIITTQEPNTSVPLALLPAAFGAFIGMIIAVTTIPKFIAAYGLLKRRPRARMGSLIVGILNLLAIPLGTGVGIYAIWYFFQSESVA
jgi:hypothetical protein